MANTYAITYGCTWAPSCIDLQIESDELQYIELGEKVICQTNKNNEEIKNRCMKISKLIKEIEELNK